jgi:hypothetical protein
MRDLFVLGPNRATNLSETFRLQAATEAKSLIELFSYWLAIYLEEKSAYILPTRSSTLVVEVGRRGRKRS